MKKKIATFMCLIVVFAAVFCFSSCKKEDETDITEPASFDEITTGTTDITVNIDTSESLKSAQGIVVLRTCPIKPDTEGATLSHNEDIAGIVVFNESSRTLQFAEIIASFQDGTQHIYKITTLPPGETCIVEEESNAPYRDIGTGFFGFDIKNVAYFTEEPSIHSDKFQLIGADRILNIKNISDSDITGDIVIYYKDYKNAQLSSGKTYRVTVEGGLEAGEIKQLIASGYKQNESIIMFVQIVPQEVS